MKREAETLPQAVPAGTYKMASGGWRAFAERRKQQAGWRWISPFRNRARMEEERRKMEGAK